MTSIQNIKSIWLRRQCPFFVELLFIILCAFFVSCYSKKKDISSCPLKVHLCQVYHTDNNSTDTLEWSYSYYFVIENYNRTCCNVYLDSLYKLAIEYKRSAPNSEGIESIAFSKECDNPHTYYEEYAYDLTRKHLFIEYNFKRQYSEGEIPIIERAQVFRRGRLWKVNVPIGATKSDGEYDDVCGILSLIK